MDFESSMRFSTVGSFFRGGDALTGYRQEEEVDSVDFRQVEASLGSSNWQSKERFFSKDN